MYRRFIATIAAASIALTALGSAPAFADQDRTAKAIATILGLAVVGTLIHEKRKDRKKQQNVYRPDPVHNPPSYRPPYYQDPQPRPLPDRVNRKLLPQQCFRSIDTRHGKVRMFGQRCLDRHYDYANRLPRECHYTFRTRDGERRGYEARCLRDHGYRLARG